MIGVFVLAALLAGGGAAAASVIDDQLSAAEARLAKEPGSPDACVALAAAFMRKARVSADPSYYARAGAAVERAFASDPSHYEALRAQAWVLLGQHDFRGALAAAERARDRAPDDWWNYGTLTDALVELGDYARAAEAAQRMVDLLPGLPSYTRVAFVRTLLGDRRGAIDALRLAVAAGSPRDPESVAWTLVHLGYEYFAAGDLGAAAAAHTRALAVLPDYHLALAGLARVRAAEGRLADAADLYRRAVAEVPAPDVVAALGDVLAASGDVEGAERQYALIDYMARVASASGATYGRQLALFYADHDRQLPEALRLARQEAAGRGDIYTDDALAWALHKNGRSAEAKRAIERALRLGTRDAALHYHAGMIAAALGRRAAAARHLRRALAITPAFDLRQAPLARATLARLAPPTEVAAR
jgi:tetratricopeptide (TPR) repeat protein